MYVCMLLPTVRLLLPPTDSSECLCLRLQTAATGWIVTLLWPLLVVNTATSFVNLSLLKAVSHFKFKPFFFLPRDQAFLGARLNWVEAFRPPENNPGKKKVHMPPQNIESPANHIMGTSKALASSASIKSLQSVEEASDSYSSSDSASDSSSSANESSDSHSLNGSASRKRRKISPVEVDAPLLPTTSVPSRIRARPQDNGNDKQTSNGTVLAPLDTTTTFSALNVKPWLVGSLGAMAIKRPTGIQKGCIPEILKGRDCIGGSRTGSGKTVAFAAPILQKWAEDPFGIFALVLTPTRFAFLRRASEYS